MDSSTRVSPLGGHEAEAQLKARSRIGPVIDAQGMPHHPFYGNSDGAADGKICVRPPPNTKLTSFRRRGQEKSCSPGRKNNNRDRKNRRGDSAGLTAGFHSGALPAQLIVKLIEGPGRVAGVTTADRPTGHPRLEQSGESPVQLTAPETGKTIMLSGMGSGGGGGCGSGHIQSGERANRLPQLLRGDGLDQQTTRRKTSRALAASDCRRHYSREPVREEQA